MSAILLSCGLFSLGLYGVLTRRDLIAILASVEVMIGSALMMFIFLSPASASPQYVHASALLVLVMAAAEAALGLSLIVAVFARLRTSRIDQMREVNG